MFSDTAGEFIGENEKTKIYPRGCSRAKYLQASGKGFGDQVLDCATSLVPPALVSYPERSLHLKLSSNFGLG